MPRNCRWIAIAVCFTIGLPSLTPGTAWAAAADESSREPPLVREILVPFEALSVLLEAETERVFLTRDEYTKLLAAARDNLNQGERSLALFEQGRMLPPRQPNQPGAQRQNQNVCGSFHAPSPAEQFPFD